MTSTRSSHVRWFLIFWLFVLSAVSFLDRVNISIASNSIVEQYGFNNVQLGYIFSALLAGYALFQTAGPRRSRRKLNPIGPTQVNSPEGQDDGATSGCAAFSIA